MEEDWGQGDEIITPAPSATSSAPAQAASQAEPGLLSTKAGRLAQGMIEPVVGGAQTVGHILSTAPGRALMSAVNPAFGTVSQAGGEALSKTSDVLAQGASDVYQKSRAEAGLTPEDWDYWAGAGNILSPANYFPGSATKKAVAPATSAIGRVASRIGQYLPGSFVSEIDRLALPAAEKIGLTKRLGKLAARGTLGGAAFGSQQPVADLGSDETFAERKALQTGIGGVFGAVAEPAITGAVNTAIRAGRQLFPSGRTKAAAERLGDILTERGENPETLRAAMEAPGAQGTVAERTASPTMAGVEQRLEVDDPVFAQNLERQRAKTRGEIESGAEQAIEGGNPMLVREASLQAKANTDEAMGMLRESVKAKHEKELVDLQDRLDLARYNVTNPTKKMQSDVRSNFARRSEALAEQEAAAQTQYERVSTALDEMIADAEKRAQEASSAFGGSGPEDRRLANMAEAETQRSIKDELKSIERNSWSSAIDEHGHKPVENTAPFLDSLSKSDEIMHVRKYPPEAKAIIDSWKEAIESGETIPLKKAQNDRSFILELGREARAGANPDLRFASAAKELAEGIYEAMASVPGLETPRAITRAIKERYGQTYAGELARVGSAGAPAIAPELALEKAISGGGASAAMRMRQLEEAAAPLTIEPRGGAKAPTQAAPSTSAPESVASEVTQPTRMSASERAKKAEELLAEKQKYKEMSAATEDEFESAFFQRMAKDVPFRREAERVGYAGRNDKIRLLGTMPPYGNVGIKARNIARQEAEDKYVYTPVEKLDELQRLADEAKELQKPAIKAEEPPKPAPSAKESARAKVKRISAELAQQRATTEAATGKAADMVSATPGAKEMAPPTLPKGTPGVGDDVVVKIGAMTMPGGKIASISTRTGPGTKVGTTMETSYAKLESGQEYPLGILHHPGKIAPKPMNQITGLAGAEPPPRPAQPEKPKAAPKAPTPPVRPIAPSPAAPAPKAAATKPTKPASTPASIEKAVLSSDRTAEVRANQERFLRIYAEKLIDPATGRISPNKTDVFLRDNKDLMQRFPGLANDLQTASNAAREAKESVTRAKVGKIEQKAELAKTLDGIQSERSAIKKATFDQLVSIDTGLINPNKVESYLRDNAEIISKYPELRKELNDLVKKTKTLAEVEANIVPEVRGRERAYKERLAEIQGSQDKIDKRAYAKFAKADDPMSVVRESFKSDDLLSSLEDMAQSVKGGPKGTTAGLRRLIFDHGMERSTKGEKLDFQKLYDFYFKPFGSHGGSVSDVLRAKGTMKESQVNGLKAMLRKGIEHQNYRKNAHVIPEISTPLGAMLDAAFRSFGAHYGALLTPGAGIHGAAAGSKLARNIIKMPARRMGDLLKQALEEPELMNALLSKATRKNESELNTIIRRSLIRGGILGGMDISKSRPDSSAYQ